MRLIRKLNRIKMSNQINNRVECFVLNTIDKDILVPIGMIAEVGALARAQEYDAEQKHMIWRTRKIKAFSLYDCEEPIHVSGDRHFVVIKPLSGDSSYYSIISEHKPKLVHLDEPNIENEQELKENYFSHHFVFEGQMFFVPDFLSLEQR